MAKVKILILKNTVCGGVPVSRGDMVPASEADARLLVAMKKAVSEKVAIAHEKKLMRAEARAAAAAEGDDGDEGEADDGDEGEADDGDEGEADDGDEG